MGRPNRFALLVRAGLIRMEGRELSSHIWNVKRPNGQTIILGLRAFAVAFDARRGEMADGKELMEHAARFAGMVMEDSRQKGSRPYRGNNALKNLREQHERSRGRRFGFATGWNKDNYLKAGMTVLERLPEMLGWEGDCPIQPALDKLLDDELSLIDALEKGLDARTNEFVGAFFGTIDKAVHSVSSELDEYEVTGAGDQP